MTMRLPPVIERELRLRAGRGKTWWIRLAIVFVAIAGWLIPIMLGRPGATSGKGALLAISFFPALVAALCGVLTTADCVSRERREGTLDLLLMTGLHPIEILLQKMIAVTASVFSGLLAVSP